MKTQILSVLLDLYSAHVSKYLKTLPALERNNFFFLKNCLDSLPPPNNAETTRESLLNEENKVTKDHFRLIDFKLPVSTKDGFSGYILEVDTIIPGSFYNFCCSICCSENAPKKYKTFSIKPFDERKPVEYVEIHIPVDEMPHEETIQSEDESVENIQSNMARIATRTRGPRTEASTDDEISFHTPMDMSVGMSELFKSKVKEYKDSQEISVFDFFIDTLGLFKVQLNDQDSSSGFQTFEEEVKQFMTAYIPDEVLHTIISTETPLDDNTETDE